MEILTDVSNLASMAIVGVAFSFAVKYLKGVLGMKGVETKVIVVLLSFVLGVIFWILKEINVWGTFITILTVSQTVYALFINKV